MPGQPLNTEDNTKRQVNSSSIEDEIVARFVQTPNLALSAARHLRNSTSTL